MKNSKNKTTETQVVNEVVEKVISKSDVCRELVMKQSDITLKYVNQELTKRGFNTMYVLCRNYFLVSYILEIFFLRNSLKQKEEHKLLSINSLLILFLIKM